jgi:hypothetical protein
MPYTDARRFDRRGLGVIHAIRNRRDISFGVFVFFSSWVALNPHGVLKYILSFRFASQILFSRIVP